MEEKDLDIIQLRQNEKGILKTKGEREVVVSIVLIPGADEFDNTELVQELKLAYLKYYSRVAEYKEGI